MKLIDHPNLLQAHYSFTIGCHLWDVMPYMAGGSCLHIMKTSLFKRVLKALIYLHTNGHIHRDVKASYILINSNGAVKLVDFGVSACTFHTRDRQGSINTFAGTPYWMAPEVMQQFHGYDFKADIWSFGITALELAHGHAPFSKYPPMKVLLMTLQIAPPGIDYERDEIFKGLIGSCLLGEGQKKRPTLEKIIKHHFFKHARPTDYLSCTILDGLAPLGDRFWILKQEYIQGISAKNFNLEDLKSSAALVSSLFCPEILANDVSHIEDGQKKMDGYKDDRFPADRVPHEMQRSNAILPIHFSLLPLLIFCLKFREANIDDQNDEIIVDQPVVRSETTQIEEHLISLRHSGRVVRQPDRYMGIGDALNQEVIKEENTSRGSLTSSEILWNSEENLADPFTKTLSSRYVMSHIEQDHDKIRSSTNLCLIV
ncbi:hypothetical protein UlMin_012711 [Ulmus minor]